MDYSVTEKDRTVTTTALLEYQGILASQIAHLDAVIKHTEPHRVAAFQSIRNALQQSLAIAVALEAIFNDAATIVATMEGHDEYRYDGIDPTVSIDAVYAPDHDPASHQ